MNESWIPLVYYLVPAMVLFYIAVLVMLRNRHQTEHKLAAAIMYCFHLWFLGEYLSVTLPISFIRIVNLFLITPVILMAVGLSYPLFLLLTGYKKVKRVTSLVFITLIALYITLLNTSFITAFRTDTTWPYVVPGPAYVIATIVLNLYSVALITLVWIRTRREPAGMKRKSMIVMSIGLIATYLTVSAAGLLQDRISSLWNHIPVIAPYGTLIVTGCFLYVLNKYSFIPVHNIYKNWFQLSKTAGLILDESGRIIDCNPAFEQISGYRHEELRGQSFFSLIEVKLSEIGDFRKSIQSKEVLLYRADQSMQAVMLDSEYINGGRTKQHFVTIQNMTEHLQEIQRMKYLAYHDNLTGLANRRSFLESFAVMKEEADAQDLQLACLVVDLDDFKQVNDSFGHQAGDKLLQTIAKRLVASVRAHDLVARLGGDEFVILILSPDRMTVSQVCERIMAKLIQPIQIDGMSKSVSPSIGISLYREHGKQSDTLLKKADKAMYTAKNSGKNRYVYYSPELELDQLEPHG